MARWTLKDFPWHSMVGSLYSPEESSEEIWSVSIVADRVLEMVI